MGIVISPGVLSGCQAKITRHRVVPGDKDKIDEFNLAAYLVR